MERKKPTLLLASFPRSGNTYLRNILYEVYEIYSWNNLRKFYNSAEHLEKLRRKIEMGRSNEKKLTKLKELEFFNSFPNLKTHEMPAEILPYCAEDVKIVYLIRDGRDACLSSAHHRSDLVSPGSDFNENLKQAIKANMGSYFGGWSKNVNEWMKIAHEVLFFEELIDDPIGQASKLQELLNLPEPKLDNVPTFESQRDGLAHFGGAARPQLSDEEKDEFNKKFFRSGKVGGWKEEMPQDMQELFWELHGETSERLGYMKDGSIVRP